MDLLTRNAIRFRGLNQSFVIKKKTNRTRDSLGDTQYAEQTETVFGMSVTAGFNDLKRYPEGSLTTDDRLFFVNGNYSIDVDDEIIYLGATYIVISYNYREHADFTEVAGRGRA